MSDPLLSYALTTQPLPLQQNSTGTVTITAGNPGTYSDLASKNYVAPTTIVIDFGSSLTSDAARITVSATYTHGTDNPVSWGTHTRSGASFTFTAPTTGNPGSQIFPADGLKFEFSGIPVIDQVTTATLTLTETASSPGDPAYPGGYYPAQPSQARYTSRDIGVFPTQFSFNGSFVATPAAVTPGQTTQLSWNATPQANTTYQIVYAVNGAVQTVTKHKNGDAFTNDDKYPDSSKDVGVNLVMNRETTFSLQATYTAAHTVTAQAQTTVTVPDPTINTFTANPSTGLKVGDPVQLAWQTIAADYVTIDPPLDGVTPTVNSSGGQTIYPLDYNRYTLTASGRGMNVRQSLVLFPMTPGWITATNSAGWEAGLAPIVLATEQLLWVLPANPSGSDNPIYSSPNGKSWTLVDPNISVPVRKDGAGLTDSTNSKMWVMGGIGASDSHLNDVWHSSDGRTWTQATAHAQWPARSDFGVVWFNNKYWVMGGLDASGAPLNDVWNSPDGVTWTQASAPQWSARSGFGAAVFDSKMWIVGGKTASSVIDEVWYTSDGSRWEQPSPFGHYTPPPKRNGYQLFGGDTYLYAFAGDQTEGGPVFYKTSSNVNWSVSAGPETGSSAAYFGSTAFNGGFALAGGATENALGSGAWLFSP